MLIKRLLNRNWTDLLFEDSYHMKQIQNWRNFENRKEISERLQHWAQETFKVVHFSSQSLTNNPLEFRSCRQKIPSIWFGNNSILLDNLAPLCYCCMCKLKGWDSVGQDFKLCWAWYRTLFTNFNYCFINLHLLKEFIILNLCELFHCCYIWQSKYFQLRSAKYITSNTLDYIQCQGRYISLKIGNPTVKVL